jgi:uncharacterized membrane protein
VSASSAGESPREVNSFSYVAVAWVLGGIGALALVVSIVAYRRTMGGPLAPGDAAWGLFGDFVGGFAGTIIGLATLLALVLSLHVQSMELAAARAQIQRQERALARQTFNSTFFQLLTQFRAIRDALTYTGDPSKLGRDAVAAAYAEMKSHYPVDAPGPGSAELPGIIATMHRTISF